MTSWGLSGALLGFHLGGSDTAALGGDLAYQYATKDSLAGLSIGGAQSVLDAPEYGLAKQTVQASPLAPQLLRGLI